MQALTANDTVAVMSIKDFEELKAMKVEYLKHGFKSAQEDLSKEATIDGESFLKSL